MASFPLLAIFLFLPNMALSDWTGPCPFNPDCTCTHIPEQPPNVWWNIICESNATHFPQFNAPEGSMGASVIRITGDVSTIPARTFSPFQFIYFLYLTHEPTVAGQTKLNWDEEAFSGSGTQVLNIKNLPDVLPPPKALRALGKDLDELYIENGGNVAELGPNSFADFKHLEFLWIDSTPIGKIDETAFIGMDIISSIRLTSGTISEYPRAALKRVSHLRDLLDISGNNLTGFKADDFSHFTTIDALYVSGNNLTDAIQSGALLNLPKSVVVLNLDKGGLKSIPTAVFIHAPQLKYLDLSGNLIESIKRGDFQGECGFMNVELYDNPITNIENRALDPIEHLRVLTLDRTKLESMDFTQLDVGILQEISFDGNQYLKSVNISAQAPYFLKRINISSTGVEKIDPKFDSVLRSDFINTLKLKDNPNFQCDESLHWMPPHVFCPYFTLEITGTKCANLNGKPLEEYLRETFPKPCDRGRMFRKGQMGIGSSGKEVKNGGRMPVLAEKRKMAG